MFSRSLWKLSGLTVRHNDVNRERKKPRAKQQRWQLPHLRPPIGWTGRFTWMDFCVRHAARTRSRRYTSVELSAE